MTKERKNKRRKEKQERTLSSFSDPTTHPSYVSSADNRFCFPPATPTTSRIALRAGDVVQIFALIRFLTSTVKSI
jgi:hypothetical protein